MSIRTYRYRIYPTAAQTAALNEQLGACCDLYNAALEQRIRAYREHGVSLSRYDQQCDLTQVRAAGLLPAGMSVKAQRSALERLDRAMAAFFRRVNAGQAPGFPRFRSRARYDSLSWPINHGAGLRNGRLRLQGVGAVRVRWHREIPEGAELRAVTVKRACGRWYLALALRLPGGDAAASTGRSVGVDRGVTSPYVLSNGEVVEGPRARQTGAAKTRRAQRRVARRAKGSNRRSKAVALLARQREREANRRRDFAHKLSRRLVNDFDVIAFEALNVAGMTRGNRGLNREILDQGWTILLDLTTYKAEEAGRSVVLVPAPYTSQTCHACGLIDRASRRGVLFRCTGCGHEDHADINAAKNIERAGLALQALTVGEESTPSPEKGIRTLSHLPVAETS